MATVTAKAKRRADVQARIAVTMEALAARLRVTFPEPARPVRDPELAAIVDLERQADVLDAIDAALASEPEPASTPKRKRAGKAAS